MSKSLIVVFAVGITVSVVLAVRAEHRAATIENARRASVALAAAVNEVDFKWEYESCPPENSAVYAEWTRRLADAKAWSTQVNRTFGPDDPDVQLISASISNGEVALNRKKLQCLRKQGDLLDQLRAARLRAARSEARRLACVSDSECGTP